MITKEQFDKLYVGEKLVVHCDTEEKANEFLKLADGFGYKWCDNFRYIGLNKYDTTKDKTCYCVKYGQFSSFEWYKTFDFTIISYPQQPTLLKEFTKSDLKSGDTVITKNGYELYVLKETNTLHDESGVIVLKLDSLCERLICKFNTYDIMQVYRDNVLIWQREECSEQSEKDKRIEHIETELRKLLKEINKMKVLKMLI